MATTIAEYFTDELETQNQHINFYRREMFEMESKLAEIIRKNTIPNIAELVEEHKEKLNEISIKFFQLPDQFEKQRTLLKMDSSFVDDTLIDEETEKHQNALRRFMQPLEIAG